MRKIAVMLVVAILSFSAVFLVIYHYELAPCENCWTSESLGENIYPVLDSLEIDSSGNPNIVYTDYSDKITVVYAVKQGGVWEKHVTPIWEPCAKSFTLDDKDHPHIAYFEYYPDPDIYISNLKYAFLDGAEWKIEIVDDNITYPEYDYLSIAADSNGNPHIAYYDGGYLKYASKNGSNWSIQAIDTVHTALQIPGISLALDKNNMPHIAYVVELPDYGGYPLNYTFWNGTGWEIQEVDDSGTYPSLSIDNGGVPHISYYHYGEPGGCSLRYGVLEGRAWNITKVDDTGTGSWILSQKLVIDRNDEPHLLYYSNTLYKRNDPHPPTTTGDLVYAEWKDGQWKKETLEQNITVGAVSLAVDDVPHIVYEKGDELIYSKLTSKGWTI